MDKLVLIPLPLNEFQILIDEAIRKALKEQPQNQQQQNLPEFLTRKEAAKVLNLSLTSLDYIVKNGRLKKHRNGRFVRFKKDEVLDFYQSFTKYSRG